MKIITTKGGRERGVVLERNGRIDGESSGGVRRGQEGRGKVSVENYWRGRGGG